MDVNSFLSGILKLDDVRREVMFLCGRSVVQGEGGVL